LRESCGATAELRRIAGRPLFMSINLSARQVDRSLVDDVAEALDKSAVPPDLLKVEVTESLLVRDAPQTLEIMESIRNIGVGLALDDFGTGYSSLSYVKKYPFSSLKIDQSFIRGVLLDARDRRLFAAITAMARSLGLDITAEGIETPEHLWLARSERCSYAQGYLFSQPDRSTGSWNSSGGKSSSAPDRPNALARASYGSIAAAARGRELAARTASAERSPGRAASRAGRTVPRRRRRRHSQPSSPPAPKPH
jgi:EAL domain-containing protein (putative c-di-GMP-specific phosphodiesterase class I)